MLPGTWAYVSAGAFGRAIIVSFQPISRDVFIFSTTTFYLVSWVACVWLTMLETCTFIFGFSFKDGLWSGFSVGFTVFIIDPFPHFQLSNQFRVYFWCNFTWGVCVSARRIWSWFARRRQWSAVDSGTGIVGHSTCCCIRYTISQGNECVSFIHYKNCLFFFNTFPGSVATTNFMQSINVYNVYNLV